MHGATPVLVVGPDCWLFVACIAALFGVIGVRDLVSSVGVSDQMIAALQSVVGLAAALFLGLQARRTAKRRS